MLMESSSSHSRSFKYSVSKLIELVKDRPTIWDSSRADFRCFYNKEVAWLGIYEALDESYLTSDERTQAIIGSHITSKWRNIRDAFIRSVKKRAQDRRVKKYMHYDQLSFMHKLFNIGNDPQSPLGGISWYSESATENSTEGYPSFEEDPRITVIKTEPEEEPKNYNCPTTAEDEDPKFVHEGNPKFKRKRSNDNSETAEESTNFRVKKLKVEIQDQPTQPEEAEQQQVSNNIVSDLNEATEVTNVQKQSITAHEDKAFFESIFSLIKDMNSDEKLEFRMAVLQLIRETRLRRQMSST